MPDIFDLPFEPWEEEDMRRLRKGLEEHPFGGSMTAVPRPPDAYKALPGCPICHGTGANPDFPLTNCSCYGTLDP